MRLAGALPLAGALRLAGALPLAGALRLAAALPFPAYSKRECAKQGE